MYMDIYIYLYIYIYLSIWRPRNSFLLSPVMG